MAQSLAQGSPYHVKLAVISATHSLFLQRAPPFPEFCTGGWLGLLLQTDLALPICLGSVKWEVWG